MGLETEDDSPIDVAVRKTSVEVVRNVTWMWRFVCNDFGRGKDSSIGANEGVSGPAARDDAMPVKFSNILSGSLLIFQVVNYDITLEYVCSFLNCGDDS